MRTLQSKPSNFTELNLDEYLKGIKGLQPKTPSKRVTRNEEMTRLNTSDSINWLKKRHQRTAKVQYLKTRLELQQDQEIRDVFTKIDYDNSGKIDVGEMHYMFTSNGIELSRDEIECFFDLCHKNAKGYLSFSEFENLYKNPKADQLFRFYIKRARDMNAQLQDSNIKQIYLPFNLSRLLEHMTLKQRREAVHSRIDKQCFEYDKAVDTIRNFIKLFIID